MFERKQLIMAAAIGIAAASVFASDQIIQNDIFWKDKYGNPIYSQGGGVLQVGEIYYWYGVKYAGAVSYFKDPSQTYGSIGGTSVTCYSSTDLANWKFEAEALQNPPGGWFGRLGVTYHAGTKKYVLVAQGGGGMYFATSDSPTGPFTTHHVQMNPPGIANGGTGDQTVFTDDDGKAYVICSSKNGRANLYVVPLRESDYLEAMPTVRIFGGPGREGNCMFKYNGRYYFVSSDLYGWNASRAYCISATNILGPYSAEEKIINAERDFAHVTQTGFFITVKGSAATTVLFCGDRWSDFAGNGIGYNQWCPLSFDGAKPIFNSLSRYHIDAEAGTWSVAPGNNFVLNPGFEADRVSQANLAGWEGAANVAGSHTPGRFCMRKTGSATTYQDIKDLPNGTYTLSVWVKSSGGQTSCDIFASNFGGAERTASINRAVNDWTQVTLPGIVVTNRACRVGVRSVAGGTQWHAVDDFSLASPDAVSNLPQERTPSQPPRSRGSHWIADGAASAVPNFRSGSAVPALVLDPSGKLVKRVVLDKPVVDLSADFGLPQGVYLVKERD